MLKSLLVPMFALALAFLVGAAGTGQAFHGHEVCKGGRLLPVDEAGQDSSLVRFRTRLAHALAERDKSFLRANADRSVVSSYDGETGPDALMKMLDAYPKLWALYLEVVAEGGFFEHKPGQPAKFYAPYLMHASDCLGDLYSQSDKNYVFGDKVSLRAKPSASAPVVGTLSYNLVVELGCSQNCRWRKIRTLDGRTGWVSENFLVSANTPSVGFIKRGQRWMIDYLLPADG